MLPFHGYLRVQVDFLKILFGMVTLALVWTRFISSMRPVDIFQDADDISVKRTQTRHRSWLTKRWNWCRSKTNRKGGSRPFTRYPTEVVSGYSSIWDWTSYPITPQVVLRGSYFSGSVSRQTAMWDSRSLVRVSWNYHPLYIVCATRR